MLQNLFDETYIRDIVKRNKIRNKAEREDLLNILSLPTGSLTNPEKLKNTFRSVKRSKITGKTVARYLDCFEDSFLVEAAQRYDVRGRAYIEIPKIYSFTDLGLGNARLNFRQLEPTHSMDSIICSELRFRGYAVDVKSRTPESRINTGYVSNRTSISRHFYPNSKFRMERDLPKQG